MNIEAARERDKRPKPLILTDCSWGSRPAIAGIVPRSDRSVAKSCFRSARSSCCSDCSNVSSGPMPHCPRVAGRRRPRTTGRISRLAGIARCIRMCTVLMFGARHVGLAARLCERRARKRQGRCRSGSDQDRSHLLPPQGPVPSAKGGQRERGPTRGGSDTAAEAVAGGKSFR